jgi:hypothetical protein
VFFFVLQQCNQTAFATFDKKRKTKSLSNVEQANQQVMKKFVTTVNPGISNNSITSAISKYLIASMRPVSEIENEGFMELLHSLVQSYVPPCRKTLRSKIIVKCTEVKQKVRETCHHPG